MKKIIVKEFRNILTCLFFAALFASMVWLFFWGMAKTVEIREREAMGGRYVGLNTITYSQGE